MIPVIRTARTVAAFAIALCALTALNCFNDPLTPIAPIWDVDLTVPMANRLIMLQEIVDKDTTLLKKGAGNQLVYSSSTPASSATVGDKVSITPATTSGSVKLGAVGVTIAPIVHQLQLPGVPAGTNGPIPARQFVIPNIANAVTMAIDAKFAAGRIRLTLQNNMQIPFSVDTTIVLWDGATAQARFTFAGQIPAGGTAWVEDDMAGHSLVTGQSLIGLHFSTPGSGGQSVTVPAIPLLATISTSGLMASSATLTSIQPQRLTNNDVASLSVSDSTRIQNLTIRSGRLDFTFTSRVPVGVRFRFRINELKRTVGGSWVSFEDSVTLPARGTLNYPLNLGGCALASASPAVLLDSVHLVSSVIIPSVIAGPVTVHDTDKVLISMRSGLPLVADTAAVVLKPTWVDVNTSVALNFGSFSSKYAGQMNLASATLGFDMSSSVGFPADVYLRIAARKPSGDSAVLILPASQRRFLPGSGLIAFDDAEVAQFLSQLSASLPDSVRVTGKVLINPPDMYVTTPAGVGRIGRNSSVAGTMNIRIPLKLGIASGSYVDTLAWGDDNGDGKKENSIDRESLKKVNFGNLYAEIENNLPVAVGVKLNLLDITRSPLLAIPQNGSSIQVASGSVDGSGNVVLGARSSVVIQLNNADVQQFIPAEFFRYAVSLNTAGGGGAVSFRTTDNIRIRIWSHLSFKVKQ
jgi:hypothetical protein